MVPWKRIRATLLAALFLCLIVPASPQATFFTVFGPRTLTRTAGPPNVFDFTFSAANPSLPYTLRIDNHGVDSAIVILNGVQIIGPSDCRSRSHGDWQRPHGWDDDNDWDENHHGNDDWRRHRNWKSVIQKSVRLRASNTLRVELRSKPGTHLRIKIFGKDETPPKITATATPAKNQAGWNRTDVQVSFACSDAGSGIATCPPVKLVTTEGKGQIVTGTAVDNAGNTATAKVYLNIDKTPPAIAARVQPPPNQEGCAEAFLNSFQVVRRGGAPLTVTVTHTNPAAAQLRTTALTGQTVTILIGVGQSSWPATVAAGGVAFDPVAPGQTIVTASIPGFIVTTAGSVTVTITP